MRPNKALPAFPINRIGTALRALAVARSHNAVIAVPNAFGAIPTSRDTRAWSSGSI